MFPNSSNDFFKAIVKQSDWEEFQMHAQDIEQRCSEREESNKKAPTSRSLRETTPGACDTRSRSFNNRKAMRNLIVGMEDELPHVPTELNKLVCVVPFIQFLTEIQHKFLSMS
jgi:hypothetical protein